MELSNAFFDLEHEGKSFRFRKPSVAECDLVMNRMRKAATTAGVEFSKTLVAQNQKEDWAKLVEEKPGLGLTVTSRVLDKLGFPKGDE